MSQLWLKMYEESQRKFPLKERDSLFNKNDSLKIHKYRTNPQCTVKQMLIFPLLFFLNKDERTLLFLCCEKHTEQ